MIRKQNKKIVMKRISVGLMFLMSLSLFGQEDTPWGKYVFQNVNIGYDEETKMLITPKNGLSREGCDEKKNPDRYTCTEEQGLVTIFLKEDSPGNFETTVFHPDNFRDKYSIAITTVVEDGKVVSQTYCYYKNQINPQENDEESHYFVNKLECYTVSAEMGNLFATIQSEEDFDSEEKFQEFVNILKSSEYKKKIKRAQSISFRNIYKHSNADDSYSSSSFNKYDIVKNLDVGYYDKYNTQLKTELSKTKKKKLKEELQEKLNNIAIINFEESSVMKNSKDFSDLFSQTRLFRTVYYKPCKRLLYGKILTGQY